MRNMSGTGCVAALPSTAIRTPIEEATSAPVVDTRATCRTKEIRSAIDDVLALP
ncbi:MULTISPECIES: hypothetical protein [unclassified Streptomyces]|uniref:hypothetical protein n=1 Tax=unclassified Streptomyces TaxID=2593676 RepID=UPI00380294D8